jgi:hypothetical protein
MANGGSEPSDREEEVQITYSRSKDGKNRTIPVWFTISEGKMELLPMYGLKTKWFADVEKSGKLSLQIKKWSKDSTPKIIREPSAVRSVKLRFSRKYGEGKVRRYYPTSDVALEIQL